MTQPYQIDSNSFAETITCPYCEQEITGNTLYIMQHGIVCRQQWEARQQQILEQDKQNNSSNDKI